MKKFSTTSRSLHNDPLINEVLNKLIENTDFCTMRALSVDQIAAVIEDFRNKVLLQAIIHTQIEVLDAEKREQIASGITKYP